MRTDMAIEQLEGLQNEEIRGLTHEKQQGDGWTLTKITVTTPEAAERLGKPQGVYYTLETAAFPDISALEGELPRLLAEVLTSLLPENGTVLVVGLGNLNVTPDALGPKCADMVFATGHIDASMSSALSLPPLRRVAVLSPGVTGQTGMEASLIVSGLCCQIEPAAVIAVDALAAGSVTRLGNNVQISSVGIEPGSGVGNARKALSRENLGVPVISVGVPTVVDALTLSTELSRAPVTEKSPYAEMMVTPRDIDTVIDSAARFLALAVNLSLQKNLTAGELLGIM